MAAQNMVNIVRGHLLRQERPLYLQPIDEDNRYPWVEKVDSAAVKIDCTIEASSSSSGSSTKSTTQVDLRSPRAPVKRKRVEEEEETMEEMVRAGKGTRRQGRNE